MVPRICNLIIEYSFYLLFLLVPLVFSGNTSELFELNKMWLTWGLTIIIGAFWFTKMVLQRRILIQKTPLDIFIGLFLLSQIISTIFSWDRYVSFWGYYSRFNGGLLSTLTYIFLYYAFVSNFQDKVKVIKRILFVSLFSGLIVAVWGLPSHFGYDPTCFLFRGNLDVSCWTADFLPQVRIFSTLGQPAWLAAYLAILIPISIGFFINNLKSSSSDSQIKNRESGIMNYVLSRNFIHNSLFIILYSLFYIALLYANTRSGFLGLPLSLLFFFLSYLLLKRKSIKSQLSVLAIPIVVFIAITFIIGIPIPQLNNLTLPGLRQYFEKNKTSNSPQDIQKSTEQTVSGGTESGSIRLLVWKGGLDAWKNYPLFGTGVETFAFAYYKYKPPLQNQVSEWNFLYNKAHNEYVNYLATTGLFGLGSYLVMIGYFLTIVILRLKAEGSQILRNAQNDKPNNLIILALTSSYISILITNFFGFSVVITNIYLFMIPAFVFILGGMLSQKKDKEVKIHYETSVWQWTPIFLISIAALYMLITLLNFWRGDLAYAKGYNLSRVGENQLAYKELHDALDLRGNEPVFKDELAANNAAFAVALLSDQNNKENQEVLSYASSLVQEAIATSDEIVSDYPNNIVYWKSRVALFFTLSRIDDRYLAKALEAIKQASVLAPNDANIFYNLGVLYGQNNEIAKGIQALEKSLTLKPDYIDARYALGLFYHEKAIDKDGRVIDSLMQEKAIDQMQYILTISPDNTGAIEAIKDWER
ncbi:O-antigen ligase family protein [Candidatus Roizmanbacteria bacterium]|nr:O-antigen ligase family protein [Candidatus Roizmanbacteria bacterium]